MNRVPKGLLVPGWALVGMLTFALGCGFVVGHFTGGLNRGAALDTAERPGDFHERGGRRAAGGRLSRAEEETELHRYFFPVLTGFKPSERAEAARLAENLRSRGIEKARIRFFPFVPGEKGSIAFWATLCYVTREDQQSALADIQQLQTTLGFKVSTSLKMLE